MTDPKYIAVADCKRGHLYRVRSRNLAFGLFVPEKENGFIGIREKFGRLYLFTEYHWDNGAPFGTVRPVEDLGLIEDPTIPFEERGPTTCQHCGELVEYRKVEGGRKLEDGTVVPGKWEHLGGDGSCEKVYPVSSDNERLYKLLEKLEADYEEK